MLPYFIGAETSWILFGQLIQEMAVLGLRMHFWASDFDASVRCLHLGDLDNWRNTEAALMPDASTVKPPSTCSWIPGCLLKSHSKQSPAMTSWGLRDKLSRGTLTAVSQMGDCRNFLNARRENWKEKKNFVPQKKGKDLALYFYSAFLLYKLKLFKR